MNVRGERSRRLSRNTAQNRTTVRGWLHFTSKQVPIGVLRGAARDERRPPIADCRRQIAARDERRPPIAARRLPPALAIAAARDGRLRRRLQLASP
jgi:hypothetical protein